jgi:glycine/D-amino acid oxidase-like deaminating enzyme
MTGSYWQRDAGWRDRWVGLPIPRAVDFAVLGGGFAGLATAIELRARNPGAAIVVLEAERVGYGASGRNAGFLSPLAAPVWLLGAERSAEQAWGAAKINAEVHGVARWIDEHVPGCELERATLALQPQGRIWDHALRELVRAVALVGLAHRVVESRVRRGYAVLEMAAYTLHPYKLIWGLAEHAERLGVQLRERTRVRKVEGLRAGGARVHLADGAVVEANKVVACTNAYTSSIELGERPRALVVHSFLTATAPVSSAVVRDGDFTVEVSRAGAYHRMHGGRILYGGIDTIRAPSGGDFAVPLRDRATLQGYMAASFSGVPLVVDEAWSGRFHATATGLPIICTSEHNHALVLNVGYGGTGVALALVCGRLAACVASNGRFGDVEDTRLLALIHATRISVRDSLRAVARIARGVAMPWLARG